MFTLVQVPSVYVLHLLSTAAEKLIFPTVCGLGNLQLMYQLKSLLSEASCIRVPRTLSLCSRTAVAKISLGVPPPLQSNQALGGVLVARHDDLMSVGKHSDYNAMARTTSKPLRIATHS
jgi:hypothetical protein